VTAPFSASRSEAWRLGSTPCRHTARPGSPRACPPGHQPRTGDSCRQPEAAAPSRAVRRDESQLVSGHADAVSAQGARPQLLMNPRSAANSAQASGRPGRRGFRQDLMRSSCIGQATAATPRCRSNHKTCFDPSLRWSFRCAAPCPNCHKTCFDHPCVGQCSPGPVAADWPRAGHTCRGSFWPPMTRRHKCAQPSPSDLRITQQPGVLACVGDRRSAKLGS
jgi:hypothetical protein